MLSLTPTTYLFLVRELELNAILLPRRRKELLPLGSVRREASGVTAELLV